MRGFKALACVAAVAQASSYEEDDDLAFVRQLQANNTNTTTTATPTTVAPNTTAAPTTAAPTTAAPTTAPNTTAAPTTVAANTTTPEPETEPPQETEAPQGTEAPKTDVPDPCAGTMVEGANGTLVTSEPLPSFCGGGGNETPEVFTIEAAFTVVPPVTVPQATTGRLRRLAGHVNKAYNLFCSSFNLATALTACKGLDTNGQIGTTATGATEYAAGNVLFPQMKYCMVDIAKIVGGNCAATSGDGHCIRNDNQAGMAEHKACTIHTAPATGTAYSYATKLSLTVPAARATSVSTAVTATATAVSTATQTGGSMDAVVSKMMVVAAATMSQDTQIAAAVNFTEAFGLSTTQLTAVATALSAGTGGVETLVSVVDSTDTTSALNTAAAAVTVEVTTVPGTLPPPPPTAGSTNVAFGSAIVAALLSLAF